MESSNPEAGASWPQISAWRGQQRAALLARRKALPVAQRRQWNDAITARIESCFPLFAEMAIGFCWPYQGEFDARFAIRHFRSCGATAALPAVVAKAGPLQFRKWWPGAPMTPGVYDIPVPDGTEPVVPDAVIVPMNAFDEQGYRLGYGGGYFDRTLAAAAPRPLALGVSFEFARLATIYPQPHDIAMDFVATEMGVYAVAASRLLRIEAADCRERVRRLCAERGLPRRRASGVDGYSSPPCYAGEFPAYFGDTGETG